MLDFKLSSLFRRDPFHAALERLNAAEKMARENGETPEESIACRRAEAEVVAFERARGLTYGKR
jgi:hypothetical protein